MLGFPAEAPDRAAAVAVFVPGNAQSSLGFAIGIFVGQNGRICNGLQKAGAEYRGGNPQRHVVAGGGCFEIRLLDRASRGIPASAESEHAVDSALAAAIRAKLPPTLA